MRNFSTCDALSCASTSPSLFNLQFSQIIVNKSSSTGAAVLHETRRNSVRLWPMGRYKRGVRAVIDRGRNSLCFMIREEKSFNFMKALIKSAIYSSLMPLRVKFISFSMSGNFTHTDANASIASTFRLYSSNLSFLSMIFAKKGKQGILLVLQFWKNWNLYYSICWSFCSSAMGFSAFLHKDR